MYAEKTEDKGLILYNLMQLTTRQMGLIDLGLSCIHLNTPEKVEAYKLALEIDKELSEQI